MVSTKNMAVKTFWICLVFGSFGYFAYQVNEILKSFGKHSTVITVERRVEKPFRFPAITFCPSDNDNKIFDRKIFLNNDKLNEFVNTDNTFLLRCRFANKEIQNCSSYFIRRVIPDWGLCYTFNKDGSLFQRRAGSVDGLSITSSSNNQIKHLLRASMMGMEQLFLFIHRTSFHFLQ